MRPSAVYLGLAGILVIALACTGCPTPTTPEKEGIRGKTVAVHHRHGLSPGGVGTP